MSAVAELLCELIRLPTHHAGVTGHSGNARRAETPAQGAGRPEDAGDELALCRHLAPLLAARGADEVTVEECGRAAGGPGGYVFARWGTPRTIINAHVDTVPANSGWSHDPWTPERRGDTISGLGSADTKGAIAAAICALDRARPRDLGLLFSGDEERGTASVNAFLRSRHRAGAERVFVCEPTARKAGVAHRGVLAYRASIAGVGGHSSRADHLPAPVVTMARLAVALDELGRAHRDRGPAGMQGLCMNVAGLDGGVAFNVIPTGAGLTFSIRPWPGFDRPAWEDALAAAARAIDPAIAIEPQVVHAPFGADDPVLRALIAPHVEAFVALDFWTEAALYQAAGLGAVVVGPGDIGCAHAADEHVSLADLAWAETWMAQVYEASRG